jgi:glutathione S-transferase
MPPRPALSEQLGIGYRRIPVLAIGRDVYVDTSLIAIALERCFPEAAGFGTIFPARNNTESRDTGLVKALAMSYADRTVFKLATMFLPWDKMPADFVKDRSSVSS